MILLSVLIPTYRRTNLLDACLNCICNLQENIDPNSFEVIVSDDGNLKETIESLGKKYPLVRFYKGPGNGPASNRNNAAKYAKGLWLAYTDDDCLPDSHWIKNIISAIDSNKNIDVIEGLTRAERSRLRYNEESPINLTGGYLWSCNFVILRQLFVDIGGFNEFFPMAALEDVELHHRLKKINAKIIFISNMVVIHPWRLRNGIFFRLKCMKSIEYLINCHPEFSKKFTFRQELFRVGIYIKRCILIFPEMKGRGFGSEILIILFYIYQAMCFGKKGRW
jgi:glycosyltransferase involved in cell wall biosynthesis